MTTTMSGQSIPLAAAGRSQGGGFAGLAWLTWRQHRWVIVAGVLGFGLLTVYLLSVDREVARVAAGCARPCSAQSWPWEVTRAMSEANFDIVAVLIVGFLVAVFGAAPVVSREFEQRTYLVAWSQDVSASRWLAVKVALLAPVAMALQAALGGAAKILAHRIHAVNPSHSLFDPLLFLATPGMQAAYALFGFALGLAASAVTRRTVPAMGLTLVVFYATHGLFASQRGYYLPPLRQFMAVDGHGNMDLGENALYVGGGFANAAGVRAGDSCIAQAGALRTSGQWDVCLRDQGVVSRFTDYQPASRIGTFHLIEEGILLGLAAVLFVFVWWRVRRATTVG